MLKITSIQAENGEKLYLNSRYELPLSGIDSRIDAIPSELRQLPFEKVLQILFEKI